MNISKYAYLLTWEWWRPFFVGAAIAGIVLLVAIGAQYGLAAL